MILGIDPGASGALALLDPDTHEVAEVWDMPTHTIKVAGRDRKTLDTHQLAAIVRDVRGQVGYAVLEEVSSMPKQGVASTFAFGRASMAPEMALAALQIPYQLVRPNVWKRIMKVSGDKDEARRRASQIMPGSARHWPRKQDDGRAEAALLAAYGLKTTGKGLF